MINPQNLKVFESWANQILSMYPNTDISPDPEKRQIVLKFDVRDVVARFKTFLTSYYPDIKAGIKECDEDDRFKLCAIFNFSSLHDPATIYTYFPSAKVYAKGDIIVAKVPLNKLIESWEMIWKAEFDKYPTKVFDIEFAERGFEGNVYIYLYIKFRLMSNVGGSKTGIDESVDE
jgi:hypothetical protein